MFAINFSN